MIVLGEDYGEGASIIQERSHAFAMKFADLAARSAAEPAEDRRVWSSTASSFRRLPARR